MSSTEEFYRTIKATIEEKLESKVWEWNAVSSLWLDWALNGLDNVGN